ncbi:WD repeat-containing protein 54-like isoform X2 [Varroa jacobsoni]|uniref:WD repeat-containing protein 54 beta-propeller domain-containing protein n=1 Tax=Varroa destructor TaxID=109461 RepID=A0A7M7K2K2_VARDE|nr:WD repeat-containing protein 54-like isoform X2 [Varroa destructor]XP_022698286.1 WD repeat-containing protein 54-like isoform X2 [Varroa jacobsoni]XP_022698287.1 WD repeat-containing protein 54-like isoform X2 [Varroa jacobsoni]XP_022698289.1 WD repeat-containing protein 54-like isoform X2 [Varroa jacobsoni]XP_022698290.1 WD repeat-containing protein 54-like isoform X2 [Varroa jacobsoni]XP_022698291.1 WD repeat-containing protein 54-like isoform X2 [Varroa jacobsoni]XP_022698292.1 WD repe
MIVLGSVKMAISEVCNTYKRESSILLKRSVSPGWNNLSTIYLDGQAHMSYRHRDSVCIVSKDENAMLHHLMVKSKDVFYGTTGFDETETVSSAVLQGDLTDSKWVQMGQRGVLLVALSPGGVQFFEWDGSVFLHYHQIAQPEESKRVFARGIGVCGDQLVCVGLSSGALLVFRAILEKSEEEETGNWNISLAETITEHQCAISDIHGTAELTASCDELGTVVLWAGQTALSKLGSLDASRGRAEPCTSVRVWAGLVCVAMATGFIRIYHADSMALKCEVTAHARWITALDIAAQSGLLVSVSEDAFIRVWQLYPSPSSPMTISPAWNYFLEDAQLFGVAFLDPAGDAVAVAPYDLYELYLFEKEEC